MLVAFAVTVLAYAVAAVVFTVALAVSDSQATKNAERRGAIALLAALCLHLVYVVLQHQGAESQNAITVGVSAHFQMSTVLSVAAFALAGTFLTFWWRKSPGLGALIALLSLVWFVAAAVLAWREQHGGTHAAMQVPGWILPIHIVCNTLGVAALAIATIAGAVYLAQESRLKKKHLAGIFKRLPPLGALDRIAHQSLALGVPFLTVGVVTGGLWAFREPHLHFSFGQLAALVAWAILATLVILRTAVGFRGRRAAVVTVFGGLLVMLVLAAYALRAGGA